MKLLAWGRQLPATSAPIPDQGATVLVQVSKHRGSPGTCSFRSCSHVRARGPRVGSSECLILSTSSCQGRPRPRGNASPAIPRGLSRRQLHWNWLPPARHSANPRHAPRAGLQPPALGKAGGISHGHSRSRREKRELALLVLLLLSGSLLPSPHSAPAIRTHPPQEAILLLTYC